MISGKKIYDEITLFEQCYLTQGSRVPDSQAAHIEH